MKFGDEAWSPIQLSIYIGSCNLIMLQLDKGFLPIYQRQVRTCQVSFGDEMSSHLA